ncbi:MAG TPA: lipoprotein insertase outer membrane protein LolB [Burkholderiales bacterium]|nr:lipoprotein insertase outer membrane protein LolB [Burkholderiales bacterium]
MSRWATLCVVALFAGCATLASRTEAPAFDLLGRVFVGYEGPAFSSNLRWQHEAGRDEIWLMTPLGQTLAHIVSVPYSATFTAADQKEYHAASVESLTRSALGWELPVTLLRYWVRGEVAAGDPPSAVERTAEGRLARLTQAGWQITFTHDGSSEQASLPRRLELTNGSQQIRLVIDRWQNGAT